MIPFMNATGTKTAMIEKVVASTARPISAVPSRAAVKWSAPFSRCRTMFSRTTIASSISRPMASERAISVIVFSVIPMKFITMNEETTEIGSVRPVMTVERQELRKRKTISTVRSAPMTIVSCTSRTESRIGPEESRTTAIVVPCGSSPRIVSTSLKTRSTTATVLAPDCLITSSATAGRPSMKASERRSSTPSLTSATSARRIGTPPRETTAIDSNPSTCFGRPATRIGCSTEPWSTRPTGTLTFSAARPFISSSTPIPSACSRSGRTSTLTSRVVGPTTSSRPTPERFSTRRRIRLSTSVESSRAVRLFDSSESETIGSEPNSNFSMIGSSIPCGSCPRTLPILVRASCAASLTFTSSWNSTKTSDTPSRDCELTCLTPAIGFTASSTRRVTSRSTVSGEAPGNLVVISRNGISTSGYMSTARRLYENAPRVTSASIITAANTGRLMERLERNIAHSPAAGTTFSSSPSRTLKAPRATTDSPALRPETIST